MEYDILVIGGGASGLVSAIAAARMNDKLNIAVIERLPRVGKKILATGNGRCNLSNAAAREYEYNTSIPFANEIIRSFDAAEFFGGLGLFCRNDGEGRVYPYGNNAAAVLDTLRLALERYNIKEICDFCVTDIRSKNGGYEIVSGNTVLWTKKVIIACGGMSAPSMGTDGKMLELLKKKGIRITDLKPSLCPIMTETAKSLKGIRAKAEVTLLDGDKKVKSSRGEVIFNENNISGICIFDISGYSQRGMTLRIDLVPEYSLDALTEKLEQLTKIRKGAAAEDIFSGLFPKRLCQYIIKRADKCSLADKDIPKNAVKAIAKTVKELDFIVTKTAKWTESQVTHGGIEGNELLPNLELKKMQGIFVAGEITDIDGICGGYNLNWAWASGVAAGENAAKRVELC